MGCEACQMLGVQWEGSVSAEDPREKAGCRTNAREGSVGETSVRSCKETRRPTFRRGQRQRQRRR